MTDSLANMGEGFNPGTERRNSADRDSSAAAPFGVDPADPDLLRRPPRRPRKAKADRGLPPDSELVKLANAYLARQRMHWPALVIAGALPDPNPEIIQAMVEDFQGRHRGGQIDLASLQQFLPQRQKLAGSYQRYSCDNSSPNSIIDQMVKVLDCARGEDRFIPWCFVYADYSVTGLYGLRQGYAKYKEILLNPEYCIETTYIDDFSRASRNEIEWWRLASLSKRLRKRMIGASDGFDLSSPNSDVMITVFGLLSRLFIRGLQEKVNRGMRGAARRATVLGKLSLGFTRRILRDLTGNVVLGPDGLPLHEPAIDPTTCNDRIAMYRMFVEEHRSAYEIAREFRRLKVDGSDGWTSQSIKNLLRNPTAIGVIIWNQTRREYDMEAEKWSVVKNPRSEWEFCYDSSLAIVPLDLWIAAREKLAAIRARSPMTGRKISRNELSPTTPFSGMLFCADCGTELKLIRSTTTYKQMGCQNGIHGKNGCKLSASKSTRVIEDCLLRHVRDVLSSDAHITELVEKANAIVEQESLRPQVDLRPLKAEARSIETKIKRLVDKVAETDDATLSSSYHTRVLELQSKLNCVRATIRDEEARECTKPQPLSFENARHELHNLSELLNGDVAVAAHAVRQLTGPIQIRQEAVPGRQRGARWIATFGLDYVRVLRYITRGSSAQWLNAIDDDLASGSIEIVLENTPKYEQLAPEFKRLYDNGASVETIASSHGMSRQYAQEVLDFARTGNRPKWKAGKPKGKGRRHAVEYTEIAEEVAAMRDRKISFTMIAKHFGVAHSTVRRAYDHARPAAVFEAATDGSIPKRGGFAHLPAEMFEQIRTMLLTGDTARSIATAVGCSENTVRRVFHKMQAEGDADHAA